jgi:hypothetical protein
VLPPITGILLTQTSAPPPPPPPVRLGYHPPPPAPTHTILIGKLPGAVHVYVPAVVYSVCPGKVPLVSLIVVEEVVVITAPLVLLDLIDKVNVSGPSVVKSETGLTVNDPVPDVTVKEPESIFDTKSTLLVVI